MSIEADESYDAERLRLRLECCRYEQLRAVDARAQAASYPELVLRADFGQYFRYGPEAT